MKRKAGALSLERFAKAKQTGFDKRAKIQKDLALKAKQVNKYRKLRQKLAQQGVLAPRVNYGAQVSIVRGQHSICVHNNVCQMSRMPYCLLLCRRRKETPLMTGQPSPDAKRLNWKGSKPGELSFHLCLLYITGLKYVLPGMLLPANCIEGLTRV